jgi:hypothetical protein
MSHTPGPWTIGGESGNEGEAEVIVGNKRTICWTADTWSDAEGEASITEEDRANGRLIAAAPELLDVLRDIDYCWDKYDEDDDPDLGKRIRDVLSKAEGRE